MKKYINKLEVVAYIIYNVIQEGYITYMGFLPVVETKQQI